MIWLQILLLLVAAGSAAPGDRGSLEKPAFSCKGGRMGDPLPFGLVALADGWLSLVGTTGRVQLRSPTGKWSEVLQLPVDDVPASASAGSGSGILVAGVKHYPPGPSVYTVFLVDIDGRIRDTWTMPDGVFHSIATWKDTRWATISDYSWTAFPDGLLELLPGGKIVRHAGIPAVKVDVRNEVPWNAVLHLGPAGERIFCVPYECRPDFCHYGYCYRGDGGKVTWLEYGHWLGQVVPCGDYLLEQEFALGSLDHLLFAKNRTVVRRISDGAKVGSIKTGQSGTIACAGPDELLVANAAVTSVSLPTGRRRWSVPLLRRAGYVVAVARAGTCTIALTGSDAMVSICPGVGQQMVTTITR